MPRGNTKGPDQVAKVSYTKGSLLRSSRPALRLLGHIFVSKIRPSWPAWMDSKHQHTQTHKIKRRISCSMSDEDLGRSHGKDSPEHVPGHGEHEMKSVPSMSTFFAVWLWQPRKGPIWMHVCSPLRAACTSTDGL